MGEKRKPMTAQTVDTGPTQRSSSRRQRQPQRLWAAVARSLPAISSINNNSFASLRELDARVRKRSTVRASHALARRTSIQHVKELIAKQLNETDSNSTVTRIGEQVDGGTFVDGTHRESIPLPVCPLFN